MDVSRFHEIVERESSRLVFVGEWVLPIVYRILTSKEPLVRQSNNAETSMRHLQSSPSEAIAIVQRSDRIGPFCIKNSEKDVSHVNCSRPGPLTGSNRFSLEIYSFLRKTLLLKGRSNLRCFYPIFSNRRQLSFNPSFSLNRLRAQNACLPF